MDAGNFLTQTWGRGGEEDFERWADEMTAKIAERKKVEREAEEARLQQEKERIEREAEEARRAWGVAYEANERP